MLHFIQRNLWKESHMMSIEYKILTCTSRFRRRLKPIPNYYTSSWILLSSRPDIHHSSSILMSRHEHGWQRRQQRTGINHIPRHLQCTISHVTYTYKKWLIDRLLPCVLIYWIGSGWSGGKFKSHIVDWFDSYWPGPLMGKTCSLSSEEKINGVCPRMSRWRRSIWHPRFLTNY